MKSVIKTGLHPHLPLPPDGLTNKTVHHQRMHDAHTHVKKPTSSD